ncbi:OmpH family outer membrane protein [Flavobacterium tegetincola]|uniref:OmpH family outer membrane protein n=1 Tax=Flavobacterium tegetincola TaxID=150172 RepID=UPI0004143B0A|nr:OmpH family outer membrane protein [Flavobacterium tegetincola]
MKKHIILVILFAFTCSIQAQVVRGLRIGYIDMEYILQNAPDYTEAKNALEQKAQKWKQEISAKTTEIDKLKESLKTERVLLTKELIEEREEEILFQESELMAFQEKRFGPNGDLIVQKAVLVKPIQDQVFTAVQDIAEQKRYDFVFDKSSDLTMIFAAKQFDISDLVVRRLSRTSKRSQLSKSELKEEAIKEYKEDVEDANSDFAIRKKILDDKKAARDSLISAKAADREKLLADRKAAADAKRAEAAAKRQAIIDKRNGVTIPASPANKPEEETSAPEDKAEKAPTENKPSAASVKETQRKEAIAAKKKEMDERRQALADKKAKTIKDREDAKKAKDSTTTPTPPTK